MYHEVTLLSEKLADLIVMESYRCKSSVKIVKILACKTNDSSKMGEDGCVIRLDDESLFLKFNTGTGTVFTYGCASQNYMIYL